MRKIYFLICTIAITSSSFAQYRTGNGPAINSTVNLTPKVYKMQNSKAAGDTLMYFDANAFYVTDPQDNIDFVLTNQDYDGITTFGNTGWPTTTGVSFQYSFIDTDPLETPVSTPGGNFFPNDITSGTDTAWYIAATSWFASPAQANNWFNFGPITIPSGTVGNTFTWYDKNNESWTESYDVYLVDMSNISNTTMPDGATDVLSASVTPIFSKAAISSPTPQPAADTNWAMRSVNVDAFVGSRFFIFFNHTMNDGDVLYLDEMTVKEGTSTGVDELTTTSFNVFPNPSKGEFTINLNESNVENINMNVKNVVGQVVMNEIFTLSGKKTKTISLKDFGKGIYFLTVNDQTTKLIVE